MSREVDALIAYVKAAVPGAVVTATLGHYISPSNPCSPHTALSLHCADATNGKGLAVDWGGDEAMRLAVFNALRPAAGQLAELFHNGPGITQVVKNGAWHDGRATLGAETWEAHKNHVHSAVHKGVFLVPPQPATTQPAPVGTAGSGPPTVTATPYPEGENMLTRHDVDIPALDGQGRGWVEVDVPADRIVSMVVNGPYPPVDGYWEVPVLARQDRGGKTIISVTEGAPNEHLLIAVWTTG